MKQLFIALLLFTTACDNMRDTSDYKKIEDFLSEELGKNKTADLYIVHPNVCGACSNDFLVFMSKKDKTDQFYILATGEFKKENAQAVKRLGKKVIFVDGNKLARMGVSNTTPHRIYLENGKIKSMSELDLSGGKYTFRRF